MKPLPVDFGVYALNRHINYAASHYYRIELPFMGLYDNGLANVYVDRGENPDKQQSIKMMLAADVNLWWNYSEPTLLPTFKQIAAMKAAKDDTGVLRVPPVTVIDMDDYHDMISPYNSAFVALGTRFPNGERMKKGDKITIEPEEGSEGTGQDLWVDGESIGADGVTFDVERNINTIETNYDLARFAHGVTATTPQLAKVYKDLGCKNVYVYPNSIKESDYWYPKLAPREKEVRILWQGGSSHFHDFTPLKDALGEVARRHPEAKFVIWGQPFPWVLKTIPEEQLEIHAWDDYHVYKLKRVLMDADINLCPLADTPFNNCKSAIKWYEAAMGSTPEATLASRVPPYSDEIVDGETGLLFSDSAEFVEKLSALIKNAELRKTLATRAKEWVLANRDYRVTAAGLYEFYQELRRQRRIESLKI